ncbi:MAG: DUF4350 domain-containing protein, partial [Rhodanobacteraceae bacterium]
KPDSGLRPTVAAFIARYQRFKPDMTLAFVDPDADPAATREAGIQVNGELTITWHDHTLHLTELSDSQFANTLARLARGSERMVAFVTGDGERNAAGKANADVGQFMAALEQRGLRALPLNFAQVGQVPQNTDLVVLASPLATVGTGAVHALLDYLARGGNLLWLTEPDPRDLGLKPLARALDIQVLPGMLVDGGGAALGLKDPRVVAVGTYPQHAITDGFALTTVFPQVAPLAKVAAQGWDIRPILSSGPQSWNELQPIDKQNQSTIQYDADAGELKGPLDFGFALTRLSPSPDKREQRVVVIGDGDFLSNSFLGNAGNAALGRRIFNWLLGDDKLVTLPPRPAPDRHLDLSQTGLTVLAFGLLLALPLLLLLFTAVMAWRRRRR